MNTQIEFEDLGLTKNILSAIKKKGFKIATEIQEKVIPIILKKDNDIIGIAQTGTGKTAAFGLPIIDKLEAKKEKFPRTLILAPARELSIQVCSELNSYKGDKKLNIIPVYGGQPINIQIKELEKGVDIVVGTPGRVLDLLKRRKLILEKLEYFILDEADEMLNMGFIDDIETIFKASNKTKRVLLFSATIPEKIKNLSKKYMKNQMVVEIKKKIEEKAKIKQIFYELRERDKIDALCKIIDFENLFYGIIFCKTRANVEELTTKLKRRRYKVDCIHGEIAQNKREKILQKFRDLKLNILVATDVAARGIDIKNLSHVVNYSLPQEAELFIHRVGRTGRAGKEGTAITFISPREYSKLAIIEKMIKKKIDKGSMPSSQDVETKKTEKIKKEITSLILSNKDSKFGLLTSEILKELEPQDVISVLLNEIYGKKKEDYSYEKEDKKEGRNYSKKNYSNKKKDYRTENRENRFNKKSYRQGNNNNNNTRLRRR